MEKIFTNKQMCNMPDGTKVRIKLTVDCHPKFHEGGTLSVDYDDLDKGEHPFGIVVKGFGICKEFKAADYELL